MWRQSLSRPMQPLYAACAPQEVFQSRRCEFGGPVRPGFLTRGAICFVRVGRATRPVLERDSVYRVALSSMIRIRDFSETTIVRLFIHEAESAVSGSE